MSHDHLKKRLERLSDNNAQEGSANTFNKDKLDIEKLVQVLTETRQEMRENRKDMQQAITELQDKLESCRKQINFQKIVIRDLTEELAEQKHSTQLQYQIITSAISRKRRFWPFGKERSC